MNDDIKNRMAQALMQAQMADPAAAVPQDPYMLNQPLETAAAPNSPPIHPMIDAIMRHVGLFSAIRNRRNQAIVDPTGTVPL